MLYIHAPKSSTSQPACLVGLLQEGRSHSSNSLQAFALVVPCETGENIPPSCV